MFAGNSSGRLLLLIVAGVIGLAIVALGFMLFSDSGSRDFPPDSAEARVDEFIRAVASGNRKAAHEMLTESSKTKCPFTRFRPDEYEQIAEARVTIEQLLELGNNRVEITIDVTHIDVSFPYANERSSREYFVLEHNARGWLIQEHSWPRSGCPIPDATANHLRLNLAHIDIELES